MHTNSTSTTSPGDIGRIALAKANLPALNAKGFCAFGDFTPEPDATAFVDNALWRLARINVFFRFSIDVAPYGSDKTRVSRGMACRLQSRMMSHDLLLSSEPGHITMPLSDAAPVPASYGTTPYYSNHAFLFTGHDGGTRPARLMTWPEAGVRYLTPLDEAKVSDDFLKHEMDERLLFGPIGFSLYAQLPSAHDVLVDPRQAWHGRRHLLLGRLRVTALSDDNFVVPSFAPVRLPFHVAPTADPTLIAWAELMGYRCAPSTVRK